MLATPSHEQFRAKMRENCNQGVAQARTVSDTLNGGGRVKAVMLLAGMVGPWTKYIEEVGVSSIGRDGFTFSWRSDADVQLAEAVRGVR
jgi:hypothetical protein